jgi:hypothetical protein
MKKAIDYITSWWKFVLVLAGICTVILQALSIAGDVKKNTEEINRINLWQVSSRMFEIQKTFNCFEDAKCLVVLSPEGKELYRELMRQRDELVGDTEK